ncbi:hypothetical protein EDD16DRAFT_1601578, partial [Pisolithus croceorrhizus]
MHLLRCSYCCLFRFYLLTRILLLSRQLFAWHILPCPCAWMPLRPRANHSRYSARSSSHDSRFKPGPSTTVATTTKPPPPNVTLTASPSLRPPSRTQTCYRTPPTIRTDAQLRSDCALGCGDVAVWRIGVLV